MCYILYDHVCCKFSGTDSQGTRGLIRWSHAQAALRNILQEQLEGIKSAGTWKAERIITSRQDVAITVQGSQKKILNFCANNYLGLSVS